MTSTARDRATRIGGVTLLACGMLFSNHALPQTTASEADNSAEPKVPVELLQGPVLKHSDPARYYPDDEIRRYGEGWVKLGFMVDPKGKPFEITVLDSTGDKVFEQAAVATLEHSTFEPGMLNGKPTEAAGDLNVIYRLEGGVIGAQPPFVREYGELLKAIAAGDQSVADAAMRKLKITNLYEDAFYGLARYQYALKWGTQLQQLAGLRRATAIESEAKYLPKDQYRDATIARFSLEVRTRRYGEALETWHVLDKMGLDAKRTAPINAVVRQLTTLKSDDRRYEVSDVMPAQGSWSLDLFKRHFQLDVSDGYVSQIKLYCAKRYVYFAFDPKLQYDVDPKYGSCWMELLGAPGTKFNVFQF